MSSSQEVICFCFFQERGTNHLEMIKDKTIKDYLQCPIKYIPLKLPPGGSVKTYMTGYLKYSFIVFQYNEKEKCQQELLSECFQKLHPVVLASIRGDLGNVGKI